MMVTPVLLALVAATPANDPALKQAMKLFAKDPPIAKVQQAALEHFRVAQDDLSGYRTSARLKGLMPSVTGSYSQDNNRLDTFNTNRQEWRGEAAFNAADPQLAGAESGLGRGYAASVSWNLSSLVFDSNMLETYALVGIHEDILKEVTRLYYTRQHNILALELNPPSDARARAALYLRTREIEAMLDGLTGGAWSRMVKGDDE
jgi:hypothetical protein